MSNVLKNVLKSGDDKRLFDKKLYVAMHPARRDILVSLDKSKSYASKLADELHLNPKVVQFHLDILQKYGLVAGEFGLESPSDGRPVAVRYFTLTKDGQQLVDLVQNIPRQP